MQDYAKTKIDSAIAAGGNVPKRDMRWGTVQQEPKATTEWFYHTRLGIIICYLNHCWAISDAIQEQIYSMYFILNTNDLQPNP